MFPIARPVDEEDVEIDDPKEAKRYLVARSGDHLMCSFQCDLCHFINLNARRPNEHNPQDQRLLKYIRRAQLDAFWVSEPDTVQRNAAELRRGANIARSLGFGHRMFRPMGPFPLEDTLGMGAAIVMLELSLNAGKNAKHVQFDTIRKFRSAYSNVYHASVGGLEGSTLSNGKHKMTITNCPTNGDWFARFTAGCHKRMGDVSCPDRALSIPIMLEMFKQLEEEWIASGESSFEIALEAAFYVLGFTAGLRGEEIPKADLLSVIKHWDESGRHDPPHVIVGLIGRFKGESGFNYHVLPLVVKTKSGMEPRKWLGRLKSCYEAKGIRHGPLFRNADGSRMRIADMTDTFLRRLSVVQHRRPDILPRDVDIEAVYGIRRSFRRGSTSRATDMGVPEDVINANNRWRKHEKAKARKAKLEMVEHYTDVTLSVRQLLRYSENM